MKKLSLFLITTLLVLPLLSCNQKNTNREEPEVWEVLKKYHLTSEKDKITTLFPDNPPDNPTKRKTVEVPPKFDLSVRNEKESKLYKDTFAVELYDGRVILKIYCGKEFDKNRAVYNINNISSDAPKHIMDITDAIYGIIVVESDGEFFSANAYVDDFETGGHFSLYYEPFFNERYFSFTKIIDIETLEAYANSLATATLDVYYFTKDDWSVVHKVAKK